MKQLHYVYMKHVMGGLEHDAIIKQAEKCGVDSVKKYLNMIVGFEIDRLRRDYIGTLSDEELTAYRGDQNDSGAKSSDGIPF